MSASLRRPLLLTLPLLALLLPGACGKQTRVHSPVVRVDFRHTLPQATARRLEADEAGRPCSQQVTLSEGEASQKFEVRWSVLDEGPRSYLLALEVVPVGETRGAHNPEASAAVGEVTLAPAGERQEARTTVTLLWTANKGCQRLQARKGLTLRAGGPHCPRPKPAMKLLE